MSQSPVPAIVILGEASIATAKHIANALECAEVFGLQGRVTSADTYFTDFGSTLRRLYEDGRPIVALCAAGIVIRALAALLANKRTEPPVLAIAEDGSAVVPLLGGLSGVNELARQIGEALNVPAAITTTGELRFGVNLLHPPKGYTLANPDAAKRFTSDMLAGATVQLNDRTGWLDRSKLPFSRDGTLTISITPDTRQIRPNELLYHPATIAVAIEKPMPDLIEQLETTLFEAKLAKASLGLLLAHDRDCNTAIVHDLAAHFALPLRFVETEKSLVQQSVEKPLREIQTEGLTLAVAATPADILRVGRKRGRLSVVGLGPGDRQFMTPAVAQELEQADDLLGYETYIRMAEHACGAFRADQTIHATDNREEMQRARHAFALAASGHSVVMISSGDPGVFAMATAVIEALHESDAPAWHAVELVIQPGISAAFAASAKAGAPLGHDFCILSLSDNLKPWSIIEKRLELVCEADLAMAFYNPISKARPLQLAKAIAILRRYRAPETPVVLGRDIGRPAESIKSLTLRELTPEQVDMRTVVIVGSSTTRSFGRTTGGDWTYTPRWYGDH